MGIVADAFSLCVAGYATRVLSVLRLEFLVKTFCIYLRRYSGTIDAIDLLARYKSNDEYIIWNEIISRLVSKFIDISNMHLSRLSDCRLAALESVWADETVIGNIKRFSIDLLSAVMQNVGWIVNEQDSHQHKLLRVIVIKHLLRCITQFTMGQCIHLDYRCQT
jgi:hypothetical protein